MTKYKFLYFKNNSPEVRKFINKHGESINGIIKSCFNVDYHDDYSWICEYDTFYMVDNSTEDVVAYAETKYKNAIEYNANVEKYRLISLDEDASDDIYSQRRSVLIGPVVESLCRDSNPKHKGVGKIFLDKICEHYKRKKEKYVYIVPESTKYKVYGEDDCGVEINKDEYIKSQMELQEYYGKFGFHEMTDHYEVDVCTRYGYSPVVFFPVYRKKL